VGGNEAIKRRILIASTATHAVIGEGRSVGKEEQWCKKWLGWEN